MSNWPPFNAMIFCSRRSQSASTALRYCWTASLLPDGDTGTGPGTVECPVDEQAATRTQLLAAIAIARIRPMSHMIDATELLCAFVASSLRSRYIGEMASATVARRPAHYRLARRQT